MGISFKFTKQVGPNLKQVGLLLMEFQKLVPNKRVGWKICYLLEWKKCKNDNRVYSFIWHPRVHTLLLADLRLPYPKGSQERPHQGLLPILGVQLLVLA